MGELGPERTARKQRIWNEWISWGYVWRAGEIQTCSRQRDMDSGEGSVSLQQGELETLDSPTKQAGDPSPELPLLQRRNAHREETIQTSN